MYAKADRAPIIYCLGVTEHSTGTEGVMSMSNMAMMVGKLGREGCGVNPLRGQNNVQGADVYKRQFLKWSRIMIWRS